MEPNPNEEAFKNIFEGMAKFVNAESVKFFEKLYAESGLPDKFEGVNHFHRKVIYPHQKFVRGFVNTKVSKNENIYFLFQNSVYVEQHFQYWIQRYEGSACCADKSGFLIASLCHFYKSGKVIEFDRNQEYTYHLPTIIFNTHNSVVEFFEAIKRLFYGKPEKYFTFWRNTLLNLSEQSPKSNLPAMCSTFVNIYYDGGDRYISLREYSTFQEAYMDRDEDNYMETVEVLRPISKIDN